MSWLTPAAPPDLSVCQKLQCGVLQSLTADQQKACIQAGYDLSEAASPFADQCRQYYPNQCQVGPQRWFADWGDAWLAEGPLVQYDLAAFPAMGPQAAGMGPTRMDYGAAGSWGVPPSTVPLTIIGTDAIGNAIYGPAPSVPLTVIGTDSLGNPIYGQAPGSSVPSATVATTPGGSAQSPAVVTPNPTPTSLTPGEMSISANDPSGAYSETGEPVYFQNPGYHRFSRMRIPMSPIALTQPLPSITPLNNKNMTAAGYLDQSGQFQPHEQTTCGGFEGWINRNKGLAVAGVAVIVFVAVRRKK